MDLITQFHPESPADQNMQIDQEMMERQQPILRAYTWSPPAITLGMSQDDSVLDLEACRQQGIAVTQRFTGGAAVLHKDDLTYSFFYPAGCLPKHTARSMRKAFREVFMAVFAELGIPAESSDSAKWQMPDTAVCFHAPGENEILIQGRKVVGSAQAVKRSGIFQHGSIVLKVHEDLLCDLIPGAEVRHVTAGIWEFCPEATPEQLYRMMTREASRVFGLDIVEE